MEEFGRIVIHLQAGTRELYIFHASASWEVPTWICLIVLVSLCAGTVLHWAYPYLVQTTKEACYLLHVTHARWHTLVVTLVVTGDKSDHGSGHLNYFMQRKWSGNNQTLLSAVEAHRYTTYAYQIGKASNITNKYLCNITYYTLYDVTI